MCRDTCSQYLADLVGSCGQSQCSSIQLLTARVSQRHQRDINLEIMFPISSVYMDTNHWNQRLITFKKLLVNTEGLDPICSILNEISTWTRKWFMPVIVWNGAHAGIRLFFSKQKTLKKQKSKWTKTQHLFTTQVEVKLLLLLFLETKTICSAICPNN